MQQARWFVQLLGGLKVVSGGSAADESGAHDDREITRFTTQKTGALLAYLAFHFGAPQPREVLIEMLWPGDNLSSGRHSLSMALSSLRHQLEPPGVPAGAVIVADRQSVALNRAAVMSDVAQFELALTKAKTSSAAERGFMLADALAAYRGPLLPGFYDEWVLAAQSRLETQFIEAGVQLARLRELGGDLPSAIDTIRRATAADSLREDTHFLLFRLLDSGGQSAEASRLYDQFARRLLDETGESPGLELRALRRRWESRPAPTAPIPSDQVAFDARATEAVASVDAPAVSSDTLPSGTVTLLFADLDGASDPEHDVLQKPSDTLRRHGGRALSEAIPWQFVFGAAGDALRAAVDCLRACQSQTTLPPLRLALVTGDVGEDAGHRILAGDDALAALRGSALARRAAHLLAAGSAGQILASEACVVLVRPPSPQAVPGARFTDLGVFQLAAGDSEAAPERLFRVEHPDLPRLENAAPRAIPARGRAHLPLTFTRFFGRETEIDRISHLLRDQNCRLVTVSGPGGIGKTRLSLQIAERIDDDFSGPVCFVALAEIADASRVLDTIALALRLPPDPTISVLERIARHLGDSRALLLLDNFEQLADEGAGAIQSLLEAAPGVRCLVTSRRLLNLDAEREFALGPLPIPSASITSPEQLRLFESVQVFVDRAQAVRPDFQITAYNTPALAALCERLEGLPLALELAAGRAQVLSPAQMLDQLSDRFGFLTTRRADRSVRHRSLRAAIEWSYRLLDPGLARFFARLSIFRGGFMLEAAEAVGDAPLALDFLAQLRECSLILSDEADDGSMRFSLLETLREFAEERVPDHERGDLARQHALFFLDFAEATGKELSSAGQTLALRRFETEHHNLRAALCFFADDPDSASRHQRLAAAMVTFWLIRGHLREGAGSLNQALARTAANDSASFSTRAALVSGAAEIAWTLGDAPRARTLLEENLALRRTLGDPRGVATALNNLGNIASGLADYDAARALYEESLALHQQLEHTLGVARTLNNLGVLAGSVGDNERARALFDESLILRRQVGDPRGIAIALVNLGNILGDQSDFAAARACYAECLELCQNLGEKNGLGYALDGFATLATAAGQPELAARLYGFTDALREASGIRLAPGEAQKRSRCVDSVRETLGNTAFSAESEFGARLSLDDTCRAALGETA